MELSNYQIRTIILYEWKKKTKRPECLRNIQSAFGEDAVKETTVRKYYTQFNNGDFNCYDKERTGRPSLNIIDQIIEYLQNNPLSTAEEIAEQIGVSKSSVTRKLKEAGYINKFEKWIPK